MCLIIKTLPASERDSNCVTAYKGYFKLAFNNERFCTLYQATTIPRTGILTSPTLTTKRHENGLIEGGGIHAWYANWQIYATKSKAFAFGVMAYGCNRDLVCSLLYIPDLDFTDQKETRMRQIGKWCNRQKGPTNAEVKKLFPQFKAPKP